MQIGRIKKVGLSLFLMVMYLPVMIYLHFLLQRVEMLFILVLLIPMQSMMHKVEDFLLLSLFILM
jgi:hypothetical protein